MTDIPLISHVSDTARWMAIYRAIESERPDAIFRDRFARVLGGERGEHIVRAMPGSRSPAWSMIVRTAVIDEIIVRSVNREGFDTVVNLGAGLDARPWRLPLPASVRWIDVDHAAMIEHKRRELVGEKSICSYESFGLDLGDAAARRSLFAQVDADASRALVITEGLLIYLAPEAVSELACDLRATEAIHRWVTDLGSPALIGTLTRNWGTEVAKGGAPFLFGPADSVGFFGRLGWKETEFRPMLDEGIRLKRAMPFARLWRLRRRIAPKSTREEFRRISGIAVLARS